MMLEPILGDRVVVLLGQGKMLGYGTYIRDVSIHDFSYLGAILNQAAVSEALETNRPIPVILLDGGEVIVYGRIQVNLRAVRREDLIAAIETSFKW